MHLLDVDEGYGEEVEEEDTEDGEEEDDERSDDGNSHPLKRLAPQHCLDVERSRNGDCYAGEYCGGIVDGVGVKQWADGDRYAGEYKCGKRHGLGVFKWASGSTYSGHYENDNEDGLGVYQYKSGRKIVSQWHDGEELLESQVSFDEDNEEHCATLALAVVIKGRAEAKAQEANTRVE